MKPEKWIIRKEVDDFVFDLTSERRYRHNICLKKKDVDTATWKSTQTTHYKHRRNILKDKTKSNYSKK